MNSSWVIVFKFFWKSWHFHRSNPIVTNLEGTRKKTKQNCSLIITTHHQKHHQMCCKVIFLSTEIRRNLYMVINQYILSPRARILFLAVHDVNDTWHEFMAVDGVIFYFSASFTFAFSTPTPPPRFEKIEQLQYKFSLRLILRCRQKWKLLHFTRGKLQTCSALSISGGHN